LKFEIADLKGDRAVIQFLVHDKRDTVGVAVVDVKAGQSLEGRSLDSNDTVKAKAVMDIPLGHKIALKDFKPGDNVIKYGCEVGRVVEPIKSGEHVHVHNVKTKRWA
jgi:(2R)-sulfolactate sulfo-lyase subunit alpha